MLEQAGRHLDGRERVTQLVRHYCQGIELRRSRVIRARDGFLGVEGGEHEALVRFAKVSEMLPVPWQVMAVFSGRRSVGVVVRPLRAVDLIVAVVIMKPAAIAFLRLASPASAKVESMTALSARLSISWMPGALSISLNTSMAFLDSSGVLTRPYSRRTIV